jgi:hypothetical protein
LHVPCAAPDRDPLSSLGEQVSRHGMDHWKVVHTFAKELRAAEQALTARRSSSPAG